MLNCLEYGSFSRANSNRGMHSMPPERSSMRASRLRSCIVLTRSEPMPKRLERKKGARKKGSQNSNHRLMPPENGATVRMYRTGHGDCFLLAFAGSSQDKPAYVLIDCGYKPGSPAYIDTKIKDITNSIREAT